MTLYGQVTSNDNLISLYFHRYRVHRGSERGNVLTGLVDIAFDPNTYNEAEGSFFTYIPGKFEKTLQFY